MLKPILFLSLGLFGLALIAAAQADEDDPAIPYSYALENPATAVLDTIPGLIIWAEAELAEHQGEGLYRGLAIDEANTQTMITLAKEFQARGKLLMENGDSDKAMPQFLAAEAIARYAAQMPHLLEARVFDDEHHEEEDHH